MIHPSGMRTTDYEPSEIHEPNRWQIANAARRAKDYRPYQKPFPWISLLAIAIPIIWFIWWIVTK